MKDTEAAWLAGILEGEACFDWNRGSRNLWPRLRIEMKDEDVIRRVKDLIDNLPEAQVKPTRAKIIHRTGKQDNHSDTYTFQVARRDLMKPLLEAIRPWMSERRGSLIDEMLDKLEREQAVKEANLAAVAAGIL